MREIGREILCAVASIDSIVISAAATTGTCNAPASRNPLRRSKSSRPSGSERSGSVESFANNASASASARGNGCQKLLGLPYGASVSRLKCPADF